MNRNHFLTIGSFASLAKLSLKALRLYDQLDLLKPTYIDPESSYRYYDPAQLRDARLIRMMRQMDMPLAMIRQVLQSPPIEAERLVYEHWRLMQKRLEEARSTVQDLLIALRGEEPQMAFDVQVRTVKEQPVLSITKRVKVDGLDTAIQEGIRTLQATAGDKRAGTPFGIFHGSIDHEADGPIEICLPLREAIQPADGMNVVQMPDTRVAFVQLQGDACAFPAVLKGYDAVVDWIRQNGFEIGGAPREVWHSLNTGNEVDRLDIEWPLSGAV